MIDDPQIAHIVIRRAHIARPRLALRPAVNIDDHRARSGEARGSSVHKPGDAAAIEGFPVNQLRARERARVQAARFAIGPAA